MNDKNTPVTNPALKRAMERLHRGEHTRESQMFTLQLLLGAQLIAPASITPGRDGKEDTQIQFQLISTQDERTFFPAFTDLEELRKRFDDPNQQTLVLGFGDYAKMVLKDGAAAGLVVNPFGDSLTLEKPLMEFLDKVRKEESKTKK